MRLFGRGPGNPELVAVTDGEWLRELKAGGGQVLVGPVPPRDGSWMSRRDDTEPSNEEHKAFVAGLSDCLRAVIGDDRRAGTVSAAYIQGDFFGVRSEAMHIYGTRFVNRVEVLASAVREVQRHLLGQPQWRVIVPLGEGPESAMAIYPTRIFFGHKELNDAALVSLLDRFVSLSAAEEKEKRLAKQARLQAVAPLLRAALERARATKTAVFVANVATDEGPGVWVVHPEANAIAAQAKVRFEPTCYRWEVHALDGAGSVLENDAKPPETGGLLVLWAPPERGAETIRMTSGDFTALWTLPLQRA